MASATIEDIRIASNGTCYVQFENGLEFEFASVDEAKRWAAEGVSEDIARRLNLSRIAAETPTLADASKVRGRQVVIDPSADALVVARKTVPNGR